MVPFRKLASLFTRKERPRALLLLVFIFVGAGLETIGVGLVMPFIALVSDPGFIGRNSVVADLHRALGSPGYNRFVIGCGVLLLVFYVLKNAYLGFLCFWQNLFIYGKMRAMARQLFRAYLLAPYRFHLSRNTAVLQRNINTDVPQMFNWVVTHSFILVGDAFVVLVMTLLLLIVDPIASAAAVVLFALAAALYLRFSRGRTHRLGLEEQGQFGEMIKWVNQGLGGIKETKVLGIEPYFIDNYSKGATRYTRARRIIQTLNEIPRLFFETIAIGGMLIVIVAILAQGREIGSIVPTLALFAAAAFRLMPAMSRIARSANLIKHFRPSFDVVHEDLDLLRQEPEVIEAKEPAGEAFPFADRIEIEGLTFRYAPEGEPVLEDVSLSIQKEQSVAFVGRSGAGKTTIVDILLGLFPPDAGHVRVDGRDIREDLAAWRRSFGYIPQTIYLTDDTIRRNVAFGIPDDRIDEEAVWNALGGARLGEFVRDLPEGLDTSVGETGVRLSGGQRQRIGIARALYHDPAILVLDEATSALDHETEKEVNETVRGVMTGKTVIVIAHRLSTVSHCDVVFFLKDGRVEDKGRLEDLAERSRDFQRMAGLSG
ncbi:MAG: ABC transporter ATP-binding protein [Planctomycetota bacterium]|jgi:ATP-binding cassette subfamily C protein